MGTSITLLWCNKVAQSATCSAARQNLTMRLFSSDPL